MKRILLDQGLSPGAAPLLREIGFDAIHVREIGMRDADDVDILAYASQSIRPSSRLTMTSPNPRVNFGGATVGCINSKARSASFRTCGSNRTCLEGP